MLVRDLDMAQQKEYTFFICVSLSLREVGSITLLD